MALRRAGCGGFGGCCRRPLAAGKRHRARGAVGPEAEPLSAKKRYVLFCYLDQEFWVLPVSALRGRMVELAAVISQLRDELDRARLDAESRSLRFELGPVELEATVVLEREDKLSGRVRFWVIDAAADGKLASASTQRIKLTLNPSFHDSSQGRDPTSTDSAVSVYVSGGAVANER